MEQLIDQTNGKLNHTNWVLAGCRRPSGQLTYDFYYFNIFIIYVYVCSKVREV